MTSRLPRMTRPMIGAIGLALGVIAGGAASYTYAQSTPQVIRGCVLSVPNPGNNPPLGTVRIVKTGETCKPNEQAIDWNQQGVQGIKGDKGDKGDTGPQGPQGPKGDPAAVGPVSATIRSITLSLPGIADQPLTVPCQPGEIPVGGGVEHVSGGDFGQRSLAVVSSFPTASGWRVAVSNLGLRTIDYRVFVTCAKGAIA